LKSLDGLLAFRDGDSLYEKEIDKQESDVVDQPTKADKQLAQFTAMELTENDQEVQHLLFGQIDNEFEDVCFEFLLIGNKCARND
jgi:hypothetical protein